jgi:hypothetical protein
MKNLIAAAIIATSATAAHADGLMFSGYAEYAVEAEAFEFNIGTNYNINRIDLFVDADFTKTVGNDFAFDNLEIGAAYYLTDNASVYGLVRMDEDFEYDDAVIGVSFFF